MEMQQPGHPPGQEQLCVFLLCHAGALSEAEGVKRTMWRLLISLLGPAEPEQDAVWPSSFHSQPVIPHAGLTPFPTGV